MGAEKDDAGGIRLSKVRVGTDWLTDSECKSYQPEERPYKKSDGRALYLMVTPTGSKLWRMKYRHAGKELTYSIGAYPAVSLSQARRDRDEAREWLRLGKDPTVQRRVVKAMAGAEQAITFRAVGLEWLKKQRYTDGHRAAMLTLLNRDLFPHLGALPIAELEKAPAVILDALRRLERRGILETTAKCRRIVSMIFRYAVQTGRATSDPAAMLAGALQSPDTKHRATIPLDDMPELFKALQAVPAELNTKLAFYWLLLTAARTGEMRFARWGEVRGEKWRIPAERMKMKLEHVVPLSDQSLAILTKAQPLRTGPEAEALLFPGFTRHGALSENALLALLARAGYFGRQTGHGFRASFSTWAHEVAEADPDVIEACLAHVKEGVRGVYNRATYLNKRAELLQAWADQCTAWGMRLP